MVESKVFFILFVIVFLLFHRIGSFLLRLQLCQVIARLCFFPVREFLFDIGCEISVVEKLIHHALHVLVALDKRQNEELLRVGWHSKVGQLLCELGSGNFEYLIVFVICADYILVDGTLSSLILPMFLLEIIFEV